MCVCVYVCASLPQTGDCGYSDGVGCVHMILIFTVCRTSHGRVFSLGSVLGSPMASRDAQLYFGISHPLATNGLLRGDVSTAICMTGYLSNVTARSGWSTQLSTVIGTYSEHSQLRRDFQEYVDTLMSCLSFPLFHTVVCVLAFCPMSLSLLGTLTSVDNECTYPHERVPISCSRFLMHACGWRSMLM